MRQKHETATSFNQLKEITQAVMLKKGAPKNATNQESERTQASENANAKTHAQERTQKTGLKPKTSSHTKKGALNPTKKAFSERQRTAFRDNSQASEEKRLKTEQANNSSLRADQIEEAFKQALAATQQQKGGNNEA
ncbi:hypothetical protein JT120_05000 [Helicobacter pylori]|nr:hypothetical protein [Helicobacter pylori]